MFKVFSFVVIFISSFVFAHPIISKKMSDEEREKYREAVAESKRLKDRMNIFCKGEYDDPIGKVLALEKNLKKACEESTYIDGIPKIREERNTLVQKLQDLQNNSQKYREFHLLSEEYKILEYAVPYHRVLKGEWSEDERPPRDAILQAKKIEEAQHRWEKTPEYKTWRRLAQRIFMRTKTLMDLCKGQKGEDKLVQSSLEDLTSASGECVTAKDEYLDHFTQVLSRRKNFTRTSKLFREHKKQHEQERRRSTSGSR